jgi:hypothetical protein
MDEMMEHSFVKKCLVDEDIINHRAIIYIKLSVIDYVFRMNSILDKIHGILRPKTPLTLTYEIKPKIFL